MKITPLHDWNLSPQQAIELQKQLAYEVVAEDKFNEPVKTVAGIDLGYNKGYVQRILDAMPIEKLRDCLERDYTYSERIKQKIRELGMNKRKKSLILIWI